MFFLYIFMCIFLIMALSAILLNNPVLSVLCLVNVFILGSGFTFSLGLDYLGILLLLIYVGAISVLFLFVVMLLNVRQTELNQSFLRFWWLGLLIGSFLFFELICAGYLLWDEAFNFLLFNKISIFNWSLYPQDPSNILIIGEILFHYLWDFLILAFFLLFVAIVGPVYISQLKPNSFFYTYKCKSWEQIVRNKVEFFYT